MRQDTLSKGKVMPDIETISSCDACLGECEYTHKHITKVCCVCIAEIATIPYESVCDVCADRIRGGDAALNLKIGPAEHHVNRTNVLGGEMWTEPNRNV